MQRFIDLQQKPFAKKRFSLLKAIFITVYGFGDQQSGILSSCMQQFPLRCVRELAAHLNFEERGCKMGVKSCTPLLRGGGCVWGLQVL